MGTKADLLVSSDRKMVQSQVKSRRQVVDGIPGTETQSRRVNSTALKWVTSLYREMIFIFKVSYAT